MQSIYIMYSLYIYIYIYIYGLATGWTVRGSSPGGGGDIFRTRPDRPWGTPGLQYNGCRVSFPGAKRPGRGVDHPPLSSTEVKERVPLLPLWVFVDCSRVNFTFTFYILSVDTLLISAKEVLNWRLLSCAADPVATRLVRV